MLIKRPRHTEKAISLHEKNQYTFLVDKNANKVEMKKQIADLYNVVVLAINTASYRGKKVQRYTRKGVIKGQRPLYKKAIATLRKGDMIDVQESTV
ncbi:MAG: 50S ribosomal protein L23 [Bacteroidota bacterium]